MALRHALTDLARALDNLDDAQMQAEGDELNDAIVKGRIETARQHILEAVKVAARLYNPIK